MRDIREDLQDRANFLRGQIDAAQAQFEKSVEQIKQEHDSRLRALRADLAAVDTLMGAEQRRLGHTPPPKAPPQPRELNGQPPQLRELNVQQPHPPRPMPLAEMIGLQRAG
jgi:hypothetical protein